MLIPKKTKFKKQFKGKLKGKTVKSSQIRFGNYAIKAVENGRITSQQLEAVRRNIVRKMGRLGKLWVRVFPDTPITSKPNEVRMGKGKGKVDFWAVKIKQGQILYEVSGIFEAEALKIFIGSAKKLPVKVKFVKKLGL